MSTQSHQVWVIDDDKSIRWVLEKALTKAGIEVTSFENASGILEVLQNQQPDALISDIRMPGIDGIELLKQVHNDYPEIPVIIMTAHSDLDSAVTAYQKGAFEYQRVYADAPEEVDARQGLKNADGNDIAGVYHSNDDNVDGDPPHHKSEPKKPLSTRAPSNPFQPLPSQGEHQKR